MMSPVYCCSGDEPLLRVASVERGNCKTLVDGTRGEANMPAVSILPGHAQWRARNVRYYAGDWDAIQTVLPEFDLVPFTAGQDEPANPFLQTVMRRPLSAAERFIPVGIVSHTYSLAPHRDVAALCRKGLIDAGIGPGNLHYCV